MKLIVNVCRNCNHSNFAKTLTPVWYCSRQTRVGWGGSILKAYLSENNDIPDYCDKSLEHAMAAGIDGVCHGCKG